MRHKIIPSLKKNEEVNTKVVSMNLNPEINYALITGTRERETFVIAIIIHLVNLEDFKKFSNEKTVVRTVFF